MRFDIRGNVLRFITKQYVDLDQDQGHLQNKTLSTAC